MKFKKNIIFGQQVREKLLKGVNILAEAVGSTLGPRGRNVAINNKFTTPEIYHDGVTVARYINLKDDYEDMGAELLKAAAVKTVETVGDGTTTATILAQSIINEACKQIGAGINPMELKAKIEDDLKVVLKELKKLSKKITTDAEIEQVATISSADPKIGKLIAEALKKIGKDGIMTVEGSSNFDTTVEYKQGMEIDRGYLSPYFVNDQKTVEAIIEDAYILITDKKLNYNFDLLPFLDNFVKVSKNLVIFAGEVVEEAMATLVVNRLKGFLNVVAIQAPAYGGRRIDELEDIAVLTGGKVIMEDSGRDLKTVQIEELGRADKVVTDRDKTIIFNGRGNKDALKNYINDLRNQLEVANTDFDKDIKEQRLAKLVNGVAIVKVGAVTEVEMKEKKERVMDAISATKAAIQEGIVAGGEITLLNLSSKVNGILKTALKAPFKKLVENAGLDYAEIMRDLSGKLYPYGIDVTDGKIKDMIEAGIIDPSKVTRSALENAVSVAAITITTDCLITDIPEKE